MRTGAVDRSVLARRSAKWIRTSSWAKRCSMGVSLCVCGGGFGSGHGELTLAGDGAGHEPGGLGLDGGAEAALEPHELARGGEARERARDVEELPQRLVALALVGGEGRRVVRLAAQRAVEGD